MHGSPFCVRAVRVSLSARTRRWRRAGTSAPSALTSAAHHRGYLAFLRADPAAGAKQSAVFFWRRSAPPRHEAEPEPGLGINRLREFAPESRVTNDPTGPGASWPFMAPRSALRRLSPPGRDHVRVGPRAARLRHDADEPSSRILALGDPDGALAHRACSDEARRSVVQEGATGRRGWGEIDGTAEGVRSLGTTAFPEGSPGTGKPLPTRCAAFTPSGQESRGVRRRGSRAR